MEMNCCLNDAKNRREERGEKRGEERRGERRRKGVRPCLEMESLTGILMHQNLCMYSVCSPERGVGKTEKERERGGG